MLRWRLASAAVIVSILLVLAWLDFHLVLAGVPGAWLAPVLLIAAGLGAEEVLDLLRTQGHRPSKGATIALAVLLTGMFCVPMLEAALGWNLNLRGIGPPFGLPALALVAALLLLFAVEMARFHAPGNSITNVALALLTVLYVGGLLGFLALLRLWDSNGWGMVALLCTLVITKIADTGAYAAGKNFGRHKLTPRLSPGKTVEGAVGGLLAGCLASWVMLTYVAPLFVTGAAPPAIWRVIVYGLLLALAGMHGDLAESLLKRDMQRKDSSTWLPGLGGVLDIIDSILFAAPVSYVCWLLGLVGPHAS